MTGAAAIPRLADAVVRFGERLRRANVDVPMSAILDASDALRHVDMGSRAQVRTALRATLVKRPEDLGAFEALFERCFPLRPPTETRGGEPVVAGPALPPEGGLLADLVDALGDDDEGRLRDLAAQAIDAYGGPTRESVGHRLQRVLRGLDLAELLRAAQRTGTTADERERFHRLLDQAAVKARVEELRRLIAEMLLANSADDVDESPSMRPSAIEDVDILDASTTELREMQRVIQPLARRLAARVADRHRRHRVGRLDLRRTARASIGTGGVPIDPAFRRRRVTKPDLWLLCDVSGSVAEFTRFTLSLLYAMHQEFRRMRTFTFVDSVDDLTETLDRRVHDLDPYHLLVRASAGPVGGRSDYGRVFRTLWDEHASTALTPSATVIVTGDARNHDLDDGVEWFRAIADRARRVYWLNPEPVGDWNRGDSVIDRYADCCTGVFEVRTLRQLADCVAQIT